MAIKFNGTSLALERLQSGVRMSKGPVLPSACICRFVPVVKAMVDVADENPVYLTTFLESVIAEAEARLKLARGLSK